MQLSPVQIAQAAQAAGFSGDALTTVVAIALQESDGVTDARNVNGDGSVDRGLLQWNSVYWPQVTDQCADDPACALQTAYRVTRGGADFSPWQLDFTAGRVADQWARAQAAVAQLGHSAPNTPAPAAPAARASAVPILIGLGLFALALLG